jgi:3-oxoacyl-[acyl-carrier-protein] synthase II
MRRRVVVTGLGCVSPVGNSVAESWANLLAGRSGIDLVTSFDTGSLSVKFAGEVRNFNVADYMPEKEARHMDRFIHLGWPRPTRRSRMPGCPRATSSIPSWPRASA